MRRLLTTIVGIMLAVTGITAQDVMVVTRTNGTKVTFPINKIQDITFVDSKDISVLISDIEMATTTSFNVSYTVNSILEPDECGIMYGLGETADAYSVKGSYENNEGCATASNLQLNTTYHVKAYAKINGETYVSETMQVTTPTRFPVAEMVDLGLSVKWASFDMGAANPDATGLYLPWGDITGEAYNNATYPPGLNITLEDISGTEYDIATAQWGSEWRLPTTAEFQELWDNTTHELISDYAGTGYKAMRLTAANGRSIVMFIGGYRENGSVKSQNEFGYYWTGNLPPDNKGYPSCFALQGEKNGYESQAQKFIGLFIRPVSGEKAGGGSTEDTHEYVDLGLSRYWAKTNFGANTETEPGTFVAWGESEAKSSYDIDNYELYVNGAYKDISQLNNEGKDVVANRWGGTWHMPTYSEFKELIDYCTWTYTTQNGIEGYRVTGTNGNSIFLPVSGYKWKSDTYSETVGYYWSGQQYYGQTEWGYCLNFESKSKPYISGYNKYRGCVIRPVRNLK